MASFFFFKQKTAYEMRISDWSSDVCSSDLRDRGDPHRLGGAHHPTRDLAAIGDQDFLEHYRFFRSRRSNQRPAPQMMMTPIALTTIGVRRAFAQVSQALVRSAQSKPVSR